MRSAFFLLILFCVFGLVSVAQNTPSIVWQKALGGTGFEVCSYIEQTSDKGFIIIGRASQFNDGDIAGSTGSGDTWTVKIDSLGNKYIMENTA